MPRSQISFHPAASREVEEALIWYRSQSLSAEDGFLTDLTHAVNQVTASPLRWPRYKARTRRYVFRNYPYSLVYKISGDLVRVLAVAHDKRRPGYWLYRAK